MGDNAELAKDGQSAKWLLSRSTESLFHVVLSCSVPFAMIHSTMRTVVENHHLLVSLSH